VSGEGSDVSAAVLAAEQGVQGALHRYPRQGRRLELEHFGGLSDFCGVGSRGFILTLALSEKSRRGRGGEELIRSLLEAREGAVPLRAYAARCCKILSLEESGTEKPHV
jgi:hypothetical protein